MNFKKIIPSILLLSFITTPLFAMGDFYVGAQVGAGFVKVNKTVRPNSMGVITQRQVNEVASDSAVVGGSVGYGVHYQKAYLAIEGRGDYESDNINNSAVIPAGPTYTATVNEKLNAHFDLSVLPGVLFGKYVILFGRAGIAVGRFETNSTDAGNIGSSGHFVAWAPGYVLGLGFLVKPQKNIAIRMEYDSTCYWAFAINSLSPGFNGAGGGLAPVNTNYTISNRQILLGITYDLT